MGELLASQAIKPRAAMNDHDELLRVSECTLICCYARGYQQESGQIDWLVKQPVPVVLWFA
jgi:hypothetical protein